MAAILSVVPIVKDRASKPKQRLDLLLVDLGLAESRQKAQAVILAGKVTVGGQRQDKAGALVLLDSRIEVIGSDLRYASRGGLKLEGALADFRIDPAGRICLDIGASTGGFTDCLLQHGAARIYAADVTISQLAWKLQRDARVVPVEINARYMTPENLPDRPSLVTVDVSFISVTKIIPRIPLLAASQSDVLILVKPQFELERADAGRGAIVRGIVRDPALHQRAIERVRTAAVAAGLAVLGILPSRLTGAQGNQEFFLHAWLGEAPNCRPEADSLR